MSAQKGFIQVPVLVAIIAGVLVIGGVGYVGVRQYQNRQSGNTVSQTVSDSNKATTTPELSEVEKLRKEVEELKKQQLPRVQTQLSAPRQEVVVPKTDTSTINDSLKPDNASLKIAKCQAEKQQTHNTATQLFDEKMKSKLAEAKSQLNQQLDARIAQIYAVADQNKSVLNTLNLTPSVHTEALRNITSETSALVNSVTIATDGAYARVRRDLDTARQTFISQGIPFVDQEYIACLNR